IADFILCLGKIPITDISCPAVSCLSRSGYRRRFGGFWSAKKGGTQKPLLPKYFSNRGFCALKIT
ncbi:MAG: hypothetical protein WCI01_04335, partial [Chlorobiaceae bacterium]